MSEKGINALAAVERRLMFMIVIITIIIIIIMIITISIIISVISIIIIIADLKKGSMAAVERRMGAAGEGSLFGQHIITVIINIITVIINIITFINIFFFNPFYHLRSLLMKCSLKQVCKI